MDTVFHSRVDREIETLTERLHPARVCIDNNSCRDCTVVKVDSANKYGILLEMVQVLTDLDLIISKSYISSDGGWFMDVFHVTDQAGKKLTDTKLMLQIEKELCATKAKGNIDDETELQGCEEFSPSKHSQQIVSTDNTALEMSGKHLRSKFSQQVIVSPESTALETSGKHLRSKYSQKIVPRESTALETSGKPLRSKFSQQIIISPESTALETSGKHLRSRYSQEIVPPESTALETSGKHSRSNYLPQIVSTKNTTLEMSRKHLQPKYLQQIMSTENTALEMSGKHLQSKHSQQTVTTENTALEMSGKHLRSKYSQQIVSPENTALEMSGMDRPGILSEISTVLVDMGCNVTSATAWTHNERVACIIYVEEASKPGPIRDPRRLTQVKEQLENVIEAHGKKGARNNVRLRNFAAGRTHTERRLHQLMYADKDYEGCCACHGDISGEHKKGCDGTHVSISRCEDRGYWVVNLVCRDRPKLFFDTVCVLRDMNYVVFHAAISSKKSIADQEYYIRHKWNGLALRTQSERENLILCIIAAIERRVSHGLRVDICTENRMGLLSKVTRVICENGLSIPRVEIGTRGDNVVGTFFVRDPSGLEVNLNIVELLRQECGGSVDVVTAQRLPHMISRASSSSSINSENGSIEDKPRLSSIGSKLWTQIGKISSNLSPIRS